VIIVIDDKNSLALNRKDLRKTIIDDGDYFYECKESKQLRVGENDVIGESLVLLRGQGNYFIYLKDLEDKILKSKDRVFKLTPGREIKRITHGDMIDTGDMINWRGQQIAAASAWHCQDGTESRLYNVKKW